jgi:hypothetical protein
MIGTKVSSSCEKQEVE